jgi:hypothetical protein
MFVTINIRQNKQEKQQKQAIKDLLLGLQCIPRTTTLY